MPRTDIDKFKCAVWLYQRGALTKEGMLRQTLGRFANCHGTLNDYIAALPPEIVDRLRQWAQAYPTDEVAWDDWMGRELVSVSAAGDQVISHEEKRQTRELVNRVRLAVPGPSWASVQRTETRSSENPYASPYSEARTDVDRPRSWFFAKVFAALAFFPGGYVGYHLALPPPPAPGEYQCGLSVLPAMILGAPFGAVGSFLAAALVGSMVDYCRYGLIHTRDDQPTAHVR